MNLEILSDIQNTLKERMAAVALERPPLCEMSESDLRFLIVMLQCLKPRKVLEIGVSAGGTTKTILDHMPSDVSLFSVDLSTTYYRDIYKPVGHVASAAYQVESHPKWRLFPGVDISECIDEIGDGIDFLILDTAHALPGEFLSFFATYPFLANSSFLVLHDVSYNAWMELKPPANSIRRFSYCNELLFSSIASKFKYLPPEWPFNIGALFIDKNYTNRFLEMVVFDLMLPWLYFPREVILEKTTMLVEKHYPLRIRELFNAAVETNRKHTADMERMTQNDPVFGHKRCSLDTMDSNEQKNTVSLGKNPYSIVKSIGDQKKMRVTGAIYMHEEDAFNRVYVFLTLDGKHRALPELTKASSGDMYYVYPLTKTGGNHFDLRFVMPPDVLEVALHFVYVGNHRCVMKSDVHVVFES